MAVRALSLRRTHRWAGVEVAELAMSGDVALFIAPKRRGVTRQALPGAVLAHRFGGDGWQVDRTAQGAPVVRSQKPSIAPQISIAHIGDRMVVALAAGAPIGVDAETLERVAANATPCDRWLSPAERRACAAAPYVAAALACRWVLKEAIGKALGIGLPDDPSRWSLTIGRRIGVEGVPIAGTLALAAYDGLLIGLARRRRPHTPTSAICRP